MVDLFRGEGSGICLSSTREKRRDLPDPAAQSDAVSGDSLTSWT